MGPVEPGQLIIGMLIAPTAPLPEIEGELVARWGPIALASEEWDFIWTDYYTAEMGPGLRRKFLAFERPIDPAELVPIKKATQALEQAFAVAGPTGPRRTVNLDPGYLTLGQLVLATTKPHQHRLYLGQGIYGEVTLRFQHGTYVPWPWTYPDYRTPDYIGFFNRVRKFHQQQLRGRLEAP